MSQPTVGFAGKFMGNPLTFDDERAKPKPVIDIAYQVWD